MKTTHLIFPCIIGAGVVAGCSHSGRQTDSRPNIIYILADDLGYGILGCDAHFC